MGKRSSTRKGREEQVSIGLQGRLSRGGVGGNPHGDWLAGAEGFEPPTPGFGDRRSTNWSYAPTLGFIIGTPPRDRNARPYPASYRCLAFFC